MPPRWLSTAREKVSGTVRSLFGRATLRSERRLQPQPSRGLLLPRRRPIRLAASNASLHRLILGRAHRHVDPQFPVGRTLDRPGAQERPRRRGIARPIPPQTSPTPILGLHDQAGTKCIPFHVATGGEEMLIRLHGERLEATLVEVAETGRAMMGVPPLRMSQRLSGIRTEAHWVQPIHARMACCSVPL
jgi:hypothetical protein